ncbi:hypothetical protein ABIF72_007685 [Bradyrhizobium japonicum]
MIWSKRRFEWAEVAPYQDRMEKLLMANATRYREFMMFMIEVKVGLADVYVSVPTKELMAVFDGFEPVAETDVPKVIDTLLAADVNAFKDAGFEFAHNKREKQRVAQ